MLVDISFVTAPRGTVVAWTWRHSACSSVTALTSCSVDMAVDKCEAPCASSCTCGHWGISGLPTSACGASVGANERHSKFPRELDLGRCRVLQWRNQAALVPLRRACLMVTGPERALLRLPARVRLLAAQPLRAAQNPATMTRQSQLRAVPMPPTSLLQSQ